MFVMLYVWREYFLFFRVPSRVGLIFRRVPSRVGLIFRSANRFAMYCKLELDIFAFYETKEHAPRQYFYI